ncbi:MAG: type II toxin-antitoxin system RelE family toxin, partial [Nitrospiraceae bacterium]
VGEAKTFSVVFERSATRELEAFEPATARTILLEIQQRLTGEPFRELKTRIKRLTGLTPPLYRLRVGDYRVYYRIRERQVVILAVLHKKDSDRWLRRQA